MKFKLHKSTTQLLIGLTLATTMITGLLFNSWQNGLIRTKPNTENTKDTSASRNISPSDWNSYTNPKHEYEVKYPPDWTAAESNNFSYDFVSFSSPAGESNNPIIVSIKAEKLRRKVTTQEDARNIFKSYMDSCSTQTPTQCTQKTSDDYKFEKEVTISGRTASQTYGGCCMDIGRHIFTYINNNEYRFTLYNTDANLSPLPNEGIFNQILSTFRYFDTEEIHANAELNNLPGLPDDIPWEKPTFYNDIYYHDLFVNSKTIPINGYEWNAVKTDITFEERNRLYESFHSTIDKFEKLGWKRQLEYENNIFQGASADSPTGGIQGMFGYDNGKIRVVSWLTNTRYKTGEMPLNAGCPCDINFRYFLSDIVPIDELISQ